MDIWLNLLIPTSIDKVTLKYCTYVISFRHEIETITASRYAIGTGVIQKPSLTPRRRDQRVELSRCGINFALKTLRSRKQTVARLLKRQPINVRVSHRKVAATLTRRARVAGLNQIACSLIYVET